MDAVVLMGGCDKTTPAQIMGAVSADRPAIALVAGPMMTGRYHGERLGACTDCRRFWAQYRAGALSEEQIGTIEGQLATTAGTCAVMGTASTMACLLEALGMILPGTAAIPAVHADRLRAAEATGAAAVRLLGSGLTPRKIINAKSVENALRVLLALGGSTNAIIHLIAMAGRAGVQLGLEDFEELARRTPLLANIRPSGKYLMEDFFYAGGLPALLNNLEDLLDTSAVTANGKTLGENVDRAKVFNEDVIRTRRDPLVESDTLAVLRGNLAPDGAVIKPPAAEPRLHRHSGPAVVFANYDDMAARIDDPDLVVDENSVLVLKSAGPQGAPGMPEWGQLPIPKKLLEKGVRDMVRISDARMSGTSYGACVLHVAPESHVGGPLAFVQDGDIIELDVAARRLSLNVSDEELGKRRAEWQPPPPKYARGYGALYLQHITQANEGCDFDFLEVGAPIPEPEIH
jgi:dihydroxy-acid dehydratase